MERKIEPVENTKKIYAYTNAQTYIHHTHQKQTDNKKKWICLFLYCSRWMDEYPGGGCMWFDGAFDLSGKVVGFYKRCTRSAIRIKRKILIVNTDLWDIAMAK